MGPAPGLNWLQTYAFKAVGDEAMYLWERRLTLTQVAERLALLTPISRQQIEAALGPIERAGYVYADDAPGNPDIVLTLSAKGLDEYCHRFITGYGNVRLAILKLVCQDPGADVHEIAQRTGHPGLLVEHTLDVAQSMRLLRVTKHGQYITVSEIAPQLRRMVSGAA